MNETRKPVGAIFCGGKSTRMGRPKPSVPLPAGITMIEHVYHTLKEFCREVVLVGHARGVPESLDRLQRIPDSVANCGPIGGLAALLNSGLAEEYLIVPCDLFKVTPDVFRLLLAQNGKLPVVLQSQGGLEPLIGRYSKSLLPVVEGQIQKGKLAMHDLIEHAHATIISVPPGLEPALSNANTPADLS